MAPDKRRAEAPFGAAAERSASLKWRAEMGLIWHATIAGLPADDRTCEKSKSRRIRIARLPWVSQIAELVYKGGTRTK